MDDVKQMLAAGVSLRTAIREVIRKRLGLTLTGFAKSRGLNLKTVSNSIAGHLRPSEQVLRALASGLGGTEDEWAELIWMASRPVPRTSAA